MGISAGTPAIQNPQYLTYGASYKSTVLLTGGTAETVLAAGSNVSGAVVWAASEGGVASSAASAAAALVAHTSAPANRATGDLLMSPQLVELGPTYYGFGSSLNNPIFVPAGKGIYFVSDGTQVNGSIRSCLYSVL